MYRTGTHHVKQIKFQKDKFLIFSLICERKIQKLKHDHIFIYNMLAIVGMFEGTQGRSERKREG
jgi:hypothetical protein